MWFEGLGAWMALGLGLVGALTLRAEYRGKRQRAAARAGIFAHCQRLLETPQLTCDRNAYPVLEGTAACQRVRVDVVLDSLALRKLPVLWLRITVLAPLPIEVVLDYLRRPLNIEFWSPGTDLPFTLPVPTGWPQHASLRASAPEAAALVSALDPFREAFGADDLKEVLVSPRGLRVVTMAAQGSRLYYGVFRRAAFDEAPLPAERLQGALQLAQRLHSAVAAGT